MPAKAGIHKRKYLIANCIPAFAGMTMLTIAVVYAIMTQSLWLSIFTKKIEEGACTCCTPPLSVNYRAITKVRWISMA